MGAESAGEVIDAAISYDRESTEHGMLEETKIHVGLVTSSMRMTMKACHRLVA
jgi:hypothetical protein